MTRSLYIGVDPGPVPGIVELQVDDRRLTGVSVAQCSADLAPMLLEALLHNPTSVEHHVQVEQFVVGRRAGRSSTAKAGAETRDLIGQLQAVVTSYLPSRLDLHLRAAGQVKPWANDERLGAAGLLEATAGMRHARDAARHALFLAVNTGGLPDPLSKEWKR